MSDFFKSAFGYFSGSTGGAENDFVGQVIEIGNQKLRVKRVIAEGKILFFVKVYFSLHLLKI